MSGIFLGIGLEYVDTIFQTIKNSDFSQYTIAGMKTLAATGQTSDPSPKRKRRVGPEEEPRSPHGTTATRRLRSGLGSMTGWPMALAVGKANCEVEFVFPTSEEMGHPIKANSSNQRRSPLPRRFPVRMVMTD